MGIYGLIQFPINFSRLHKIIKNIVLINSIVIVIVVALRKNWITFKKV